MRYERLLEQTLAELRRDNLMREPDNGAARAAVTSAATALGWQPIDASSNDYLGLGASAVSRETPRGPEALPSPGASASRLIHGTTPEHVRLEAELALWVGAESALLFASTYAANVGLVSALGVADSVIISDSANHASLIDGARLAKAQVRIVEHLNLTAVRAALEEHRAAKACWVVTESYFSMDGDGPDLRKLRELCDAHDACLIVDEAHALGVFGTAGAGRCAELAVRPDVLVGALGKAVGTHGGFVAGPDLLRTFLWNKARSFVFSTAPSPRHAALTSVQLELTQQADALRRALHQNVQQLRGELGSAGLPLAPGSFGPIVSIVLGSTQAVLGAAARLRDLGVLAQAIRPPTVPVGASRLRLTVKATFSAPEISRLAHSVVKACRAS